VITLRVNYSLGSCPSWKIFGYLLQSVRATVLFVRNRMPLFVKVPVVTEKRKHAALKRRTGQRNWKRLPWNANVRQTKLGLVFPVHETVGDENADTG